MKKSTKKYPAKKPSPGMLGSGQANKAAKALKDRKRRMDDAIKKAGG